MAQKIHVRRRMSCFHRRAKIIGPDYACRCEEDCWKSKRGCHIRQRVINLPRSINFGDIWEVRRQKPSSGDWRAEKMKYACFSTECRLGDKLFVREIPVGFVSVSKKLIVPWYREKSSIDSKTPRPVVSGTSQNHIGMHVKGNGEMTMSVKCSRASEKEYADTSGQCLHLRLDWSYGQEFKCESVTLEAMGTFS